MAFTPVRTCFVGRHEPGAEREKVVAALSLAPLAAALERVGFVHSFTFGIHIFVDGPQGNARERDRTHLRDMIDVGLIDARTAARLPAVLRPRLEELLANPDG